MLDKSNFKSSALKEAEEYFKKVHMNKVQLDILDDLMQVLLKYISIEKESLNGIGLRAISMWQRDYKRDLLGLEAITHNERIKTITAIFDYIKFLKHTLIVFHK